MRAFGSRYFVKTPALNLAWAGCSTPGRRRPLSIRNKGNRRWAADADALTGRRALARRPVDAKRRDVVTLLVGGEQEIAGGIQGEKARPLATGRRVAKEAPTAIAGNREQ